MLRFYFRNEFDLDKPDIIRDVEKAFAAIKLNDSNQVRKLIELIDHGTYESSTSFIDKFGYKLHNSELSTGCKAALCVLYYPDKIIDLIECGWNAIDAILSVCDKGNVLILDSDVSFISYSDRVNVQYNNYVFKTIDRLNYYLRYERPDEPCFDKEVSHAIV